MEVSSMASYSIQFIRPTVIIDAAGTPVKGFLVRILIYPWGEARDLELTSTDPIAINDAAKAEIINRAALDKLQDVEVDIEEIPEES
jgi:hypothetical protein